MKLWKIKRPGGRGFFEVQPLPEDKFGAWLYAPSGAIWQAPHKTGTFTFDALFLLNPHHCWVAWWIDDPTNRRLLIDVCLAPQREHDGWSYVDLELDPVRYENGTVEIQDRDEFEAACRDGWISRKDAEMANAVAAAMETALRTREEPFGQEGWRRLDRLKTAGHSFSG